MMLPTAPNRWVNPDYVARVNYVGNHRPTELGDHGKPMVQMFMACGQMVVEEYSTPAEAFATLRGLGIHHPDDLQPF